MFVAWQNILLGLNLFDNNIESLEMRKRTACVIYYRYPLTGLILLNG